MEKCLFLAVNLKATTQMKGRFHLVSPGWFEGVQKEVEKRVLCFGNAKVFWNEKEKNGMRSGVGLELYLDKTTSTMQRGAFVMHLVHIVVLNFSAKLRQKPIYNGHMLVRFLLVQYDKGEGGAKNLRRESVARGKDGLKTSAGRCQ